MHIYMLCSSHIQFQEILLSGFRGVALTNCFFRIYKKNLNHYWKIWEGGSFASGVNIRGGWITVTTHFFSFGHISVYFHNEKSGSHFGELLSCTNPLLLLCDLKIPFSNQLLYPFSKKRGVNCQSYVFPNIPPSETIFCHIFLKNCWWQPLSFWCACSLS